MTETENPVLDYFNMPENAGKMLSTRTIAKAIGLRQKDVFYYILSVFPLLIINYYFL